jgi:hypothetical protein
MRSADECISGEDDHWGGGMNGEGVQCAPNSARKGVILRLSIRCVGRKKVWKVERRQVLGKLLIKVG